MVVTREPGSIARERPARMGTIFAVHPLVRAEGASTSALSANRILLKEVVLHSAPGEGNAGASASRSVRHTSSS